MARLLMLRNTDVFDPRLNPRGRSGIKGDRRQRTDTFVEQDWVRDACEAPVRSLPCSGMYMVAKNLSAQQRMVHACPAAGFPLCYMKKKDRVMKGPCLTADNEAEAMVQLGARMCIDCVNKLDVLSVARLYQAGFNVQMSWK